MDNIVAEEATKIILQTYNYQSCRTYDTASNKSGIKMELCETTSSSIYETKTCGILEGFVNGTGLYYRKYGVKITDKTVEIPDGISRSVRF